jgi:ribose transport system permease protein
MGDAYLLPPIASVVLGGRYLGTIAGVILITLLQSILSVVQVSEAGRQITYGVVIVVMPLLYGREAGRASGIRHASPNGCRLLAARNHHIAF